eukprot:4204853-Pyramimonas_sp.AAC.1
MIRALARNAVWTPDRAIMRGYVISDKCIVFVVGETRFAAVCGSAPMPQTREPRWLIQTSLPQLWTLRLLTTRPNSFVMGLSPIPPITSLGRA